ncbi:DUF2917 domain-containing protein [Chitinimonas sp.]|uniref:DUF2917 domain-containing protein n=1 Tax=Chitinimonas sp. TaxID=1934313 RepID=UPI0035B23398
MLYDFIEYEQRLADAELISVRDTDGLLVEVQQGALWLTEEGGEDIWLDQGARYQTHGRGKVVMEAQSGTLIRWRANGQPSQTSPSRLKALWNRLGLGVGEAT